MAVVATGLAAFRGAVDANPELAATLADPKLAAAAKKGVITRLASGTSPLVGNFLRLLVDRGRISELGDLTDAYAERVAAAEGRVEIVAVTAIPLDDDLRRTITDRIRDVTGRDATLIERIDEDIIGGLVLEVGGVRVDGSVRGRLDALRQDLVSAPVAPPT